MMGSKLLSNSQTPDYFYEYTKKVPNNRFDFNFSKIDGFN